MRTKLSLAVSLALLSTGVLSGCSDDSAPTASGTQQEAPKNLSASLLKYIPADSPYFVATRESMPEQDAFALYQRMQPKDSLEADLDELRDMLHEIDDDVLHSLMSLLIAMGEEFVGVETLDDIHALGFKMSPQIALYGLGILPTLRMELQDEDAFRETLQRILTNADINPSTATTDEKEYWVLTQDGPIKAIMAIIDKQLLMSVVPENVSDELLSQVLGSILPDSSIGDTGALEEIEQRHGFTPYGAGEIDSSRLLSELSTPTHLGTQALLDAADAERLDLSACQADIDRITNRFPGLVMGMREYNLDRMEMNLILETDETIVSDLRAMTAQVPGLGSTEGMASFGLGLNLPVLMQTVQKYAQEVRQNPFSCDELQELNSTWNEINKAINNPVAMMIGPSLSGFRARLNNLTMKDGEPTGTGLLTLASQNPLALLSTASAFAPDLGTLGLEPGGEAKKIDSMMLPPDSPELYAAMSESAITLGVGISDSETLQEELQAPVSERDLLVHGHLTGEFYHSLADVIAQMPSYELAELDIDLLKQYSDIYKNMEYWFRVDDAGVEMSFSLELN
ncbi:hypothetical protein [Vreelandella alkaliphila]|uniref:DUF3352 domain-containing protein n=1 Tax=Vreelandella alkaliphila TaxID=272774 RepID=A0ABX4HLJ3_9GAMM|nr:hypothetical protein [Halomonas humidisoli]PAU73381.1 hypothetical protein CK497_01920 [Halomonas humidisoli]